MLTVKCVLLRCNEQNIWVQRTPLSMVEIRTTEEANSLSMTIRDAITSALIGDFPRNSLIKVEVLSSVIIRLHTQSGTQIGLQFEEPNILQSVLKLMKSSDLNCIDIDSSGSTASRGLMPDLSDPIVQEYVIKLLFRSDFAKFVKDLKELINNSVNDESNKL